MSQRTPIRSITAGAILLAAVSLPIAAQHTKKRRPAPPPQPPKQARAAQALPQAPPGMQMVVTQHGEHDVEVQYVPATGRFVPTPDGRLRQLLPDEITPAWQVLPDEVELGANPRLKDAKVVLARKLVPILTKAAPANAGRQAQFQWIEREDSPLIFRGWHARIHDVAEIPGGWHVTLWVNPVVMTKGGTAAIHGGWHVEEYAVDADGNLTLIRDYRHPNSDGEGSYASG